MVKKYQKRTFDYKEAFKKLKNIHNFNFDLRNKLTGARKAAITRKWFEHRDDIKKIESGYYTFIDAKKSQIKNLSGQFPSTNKGIIYNHPTEPETTRITKIVGRGKKTILFDTVKIKSPSPSLKGLKKLTFYIVFPDSVRFSPVYTQWAIEDINKRLKPDYISVAINGYAGSQLFDPQSMNNYAPSFVEHLAELDEENEEDDEEARMAFTGVYIIYYKKRVSKKWLTKTRKIINSLF